MTPPVRGAIAFALRRRVPINGVRSGAGSDRAGLNRNQSAGRSPVVRAGDPVGPNGTAAVPFVDQWRRGVGHELVEERYPEPCPGVDARRAAYPKAHDTARPGSTSAAIRVCDTRPAMTGVPPAPAEPPAAPTKGRHAMEYEFRTGSPITEEDALEQVAAMGFHGLAFDDVHDEDEALHWHEFDAVTWVISGTGAFADEHGNVTRTGPGCRLRAPAGWLHRSLAGTQTRLVIGTNLPGGVWTAPINKDPSERPTTLPA